jgi:S-formylglutathione hydrolase
LLGPERDPQLFERDHPLTRARRNAHALRESRQAIYIDVGSRDALHCQDGAEYLHRALWELDIAHEYHLLRDANHIGATLAPRSLRGFTWVAEHAGLGAQAERSAEELQLDAYLEPLRAAARERDASIDRVYGRLPEL